MLSKRIGFKLWEQDVFVNVIGGLRISEPAADLALALAIASSYYDRALPADVAVVGEVGLSGELRRVGQLAARLNEARKIGFKRALVPRLRRRGSDLPSGIQLIEAPKPCRRHTRRIARLAPLKPMTLWTSAQQGRRPSKIDCLPSYQTPLPDPSGRGPRRVDTGGRGWGWPPAKGISD